MSLSKETKPKLKSNADFDMSMCMLKSLKILSK